MVELNEDNIDSFIKENKEKFDKCDPSLYHSDHFLSKLHKKFKKLISIVPYLVKVFIFWISVTVLSVWIWNSWIRKDRHEITLKQKIENIIHNKK